MPIETPLSVSLARRRPPVCERRHTGGDEARPRGIALVMIATACSAPAASVTSSLPSVATASASMASGPSGVRRTPGHDAVVTRTVDGDTVYVEYHGREIDVRLIGVDTPETVDPSQPVGCYGPQASHFTQRMLTGQPIRMEFDVERHDGYGRVLAYIWLRDHLFNQRLVAQGYAVVSTYPPNVRYESRFEAAQAIAVRGDRGLWGVFPSPIRTGVTQRTRACASRHRRQLSIARMSPTGTSGCSRRIHRTSTATTTASAARPERSSADREGDRHCGERLGHRAPDLRRFGRFAEPVRVEPGHVARDMQADCRPSPRPAGSRPRHSC